MPHTTQEQFMKDRYECLQQAQQPVSGAYVNAYGGASSSQIVANGGVWISCLEARGYTTDPNGDLVAPPDMVVYCHRWRPVTRPLLRYACQYIDRMKR